MIVRNLFLLIAAAVVFALPVTASADVITFQAPATAPNAGNGGPQQVAAVPRRASRLPSLGVAGDLVEPVVHRDPPLPGDGHVLVRAGGLARQA